MLLRKTVLLEKRKKNHTLNGKCESIMTARVSRETGWAKNEKLAKGKARKEESGALGGSFMQCEIVLALNSVSREDNKTSQSVF